MTSYFYIVRFRGYVGVLNFPPLRHLALDPEAHVARTLCTPHWLEKTMASCSQQHALSKVIQEKSLLQVARSLTSSF